MIKVKDIKNQLENIALDDNYGQVRSLSYLSAIIAVGEYQQTLEALKTLKDIGIKREAIYETVLQSYLFLGFPRMIEGALAYNELYGDFENALDIERISSEESQNWFDDGKKLCGIVYGKNFDRLKERFLSVSPDLFRWMVIEGYGKVLSRSGMTQIERELAEVAALIVDMRERQLISHIIGGLNVGAKMELLRLVNNDIKPLAGNNAFELATRVMRNIGIKYESSK